MLLKNGVNEFARISTELADAIEAAPAAPRIVRFAGYDAAPSIVDMLHPILGLEPATGGGDFGGRLGKLRVALDIWLLFLLKPLAQASRLRPRG